MMWLGREPKRGSALCQGDVYAMRSFDHDYAGEVIERMRALERDTRPRWGRLSPAAMVRHLADSIRFSMGKRGKMPFKGNWYTRRILGPLIMNAIVRMPKNVKLDTPMAKPEELSAVEGEIETLQAVIEEYLDAVQAGELSPEPHMVFGDIGVDGWAKLHVVHFEHHLRQFGV
jgi:hypothetical protein